MAEKEAELVFPLNEGITETVASEVAGGVITISENTRLSAVRGTVTKRPRVEPVGTVAPSVCGGMATTSDNVTALFLRYPIGPKKIADGTIAELRSPLTSTSALNAYFPYVLDQAGGSAGLYGCQQAIAVDSVGRIWMAGMRANGGGGYSVYVSVQDASGKVLCPSFDVATPSLVGFPTASLLASPMLNWVGLTAHGSKVVVWYLNCNGTPNQFIKGARLSFDDATLEVTVEDNQNVHQLDAVNLTVTQLYHYNQADVVADPDDADYVYLLCTSVVADTSADLRRINVNTWSTGASDQLTGRFTTGTTNNRCMAVVAFTLAGVRYIACATSDINFAGGGREPSECTLYAFTGGSLVQQWTELEPSLQQGYVAVVPVVNEPGYPELAMVISRPQLGVGTAIGTSDEATTFVTHHYLVTGSDPGPVSHPWTKLAGRTGYLKVSDDEVHAFVPLMRHFNLTVSADVPTNPAYVADPSIEVYSPYARLKEMTPVMRCAVDKAAPKNASQNGNTTCVANGKLYLSYLETKTRQAYTDGVGMRSRYVRFDLLPTAQPATVNDGGVAYIGGSVIGVWDGNEVTEYSPMHMPKLNVVATGGTGPNLTGTWQFTAVIAWRDAFGMMRRGSAALPVSISPAGTKPIVYVTLPSTMRNGLTQERFDIVVYATGNLASGGTRLFYAQNMEPTNMSANGCWAFGNVPTPTVADIQLYSQGAAGEPLPAECPPPPWHMCVGNSRLWLIDAEERNRLLPSKLKETYLPFEFNGTLEVNVPTSHGKLVAVANNQGTIVAFAERGIWAIPGYGPNNAGQDGAFGEPVLLSNLGCKSRDAVAQIPGGGLMFQCSDGAFAVLAGGAVQRFENIRYTYAVTKPVVMNDCSELVYTLADGTTALVYNWEAKGWTKWILHELAEPVTACATFQNSEDSYGLWYAPASGRVMQMRSKVVAIGAPLRVARGWIVPETPQGDCAMHEVWLHARNAGEGLNHDAKIRITYDYNDTTGAVERTWTQDELTPLLVDGKYTVAANTHSKSARSLTVDVSEVDPSGNGMNPLTITVRYGASPGVRRRTLRAGALK